ncbi:MAG: hypothetical protein M3Y26_01355, partial [Actinomycetota bacterium]|nr:hypothetical protein [Actinomycetota bacterium]
MSMGGGGGDNELTAVLKAEITDFVSKMDEAKSKFADSTKSMQDDAQKASGGIVERMGGIGPALTKTLVPAAVAVGGVATVLADQWSGVNTKMQAATGATGAKLDELTKSVQNVTGSVKGNMTQVADVMATVAAKTDLVGKPLEDLTRKFLQLKEAGIDINVAQVGVAFARWQIPVDQWGTTMERVLKIAQATGRPMGDVLDQIAKGAPVLQGLGFSFNDASLLAGKLSDDALPGLKKALAGAIAHGKTGKQAFDELVGSIKAAPGPTEATALAIKVFGARAGPELANQIRAGKFELGAMTAEIDRNDSSIKKGAEDNRTFADQLGMLKDKAGAMVAPFAAQAQVLATIASGVGPVVSGLQKTIGFIKHLKEAKEAVAVASGVAATAEGVEAGANVAAGASAGVASGGFVALATSIGAVMLELAPIILALGAVAAAGYLLYKHWDEVWGFIKKIAKIAWDFLSNTVFLPIKLEIAAVKEVWSFFRDNWKEIWDGIKEAAAIAWGFIKDVVFGPIKLEINIVKGIISGFGEVWDDVWGGMKDAVSGAWNIVKGIFNDIKGGIEDVVHAVDRLKSKLDSIPGAGDVLNGLTG